MAHIHICIEIHAGYSLNPPKLYLLRNDAKSPIKAMDFCNWNPEPQSASSSGSTNIRELEFSSSSSKGLSS